MSDMRKRVNIGKTKYWAPQSLRRLASIVSAAFDRRAPIAAKIVAVVTVLYALVPIDLVPDFIPVIGWLDDMAVVGAGLWLTARLMPPGLLAEHYERRASLFKRKVPTS